MEIDLENDEINKLPSKQNYAIFDNANNKCDGSYIQQNITKLIENYPQLENISNKIRNALCFAYEQNVTEKFNSSDCDYLYFWLGDIIYKNIKYNLHFTSVIDVIKFTLQSKEGSNICEFHKYNIDSEYFMKTKQLFDYSKDYDQLQKDITASNGYCSGDYKNILNNYLYIYNTFELECKTNPKNTKHCKHFKEFFNGKNLDKLSILSCNSRSNYYESPKQQQHHGVVAESVVKTAQQNKKEQPRQLPRRAVPTGTYEDANRQDLNHNNSELYPLYIKRPQLSAITDISTSSYSKNVVIPPLVIGITVLSVIMCKFTPVRYWLKKALVGKSKRKRNIIMDSNITEDYAIPEYLDSSRRFNVRYSN
ncbi:variable surface protein, partial [Plasmodium gonderi]